MKLYVEATQSAVNSREFKFRGNPPKADKRLNKFKNSLIDGGSIEIPKALQL